MQIASVLATSTTLVQFTRPGSVQPSASQDVAVEGNVEGNHDTVAAPGNSRFQEMLADLEELSIRDRVTSGDDVKHDRHDVKKQLKEISHTIRHDLKALGRDLQRQVDSRDAVETHDEGEHEVEHREVHEKMHALKHLGRDFSRELRDAFKEARNGESMDGESLVASVRSSFEKLVSGVRSVLAEVTSPGSAFPSAEVQVGGSVASPVPTEPTTDDESDESDESDDGPAVPAPIQADEPGTEDMLRLLVERFESMLSELKNLFVAPAGALNASAVRFSFSFQISGTLVNSIS